MIAKRKDAIYEPGKRSRAWLKLKVEQRQEFVVGGYTEPRNSRQHLGAILLGYYDDDGNLVYAGHTGGGFSRASLSEMYRRLHALERKTCPFVKQPRTNERAHWVRPRVVVEVKFNEWTADGKLRQPIFVGIRDDKDPTTVRREPVSAGVKSPRGAASASRATGQAPLASGRAMSVFSSANRRARPRRPRPRASARPLSGSRIRDLIGAIAELEDGGRRRYARISAVTSVSTSRISTSASSRSAATRRAISWRTTPVCRPSCLPAIADRAARHEALSERHERSVVLSAARAGRVRREACASSPSRTKD